MMDRTAEASSFVRRVLQRGAASALGAVAAGFLASLLETIWIRAASAEPPAFLQTWLAASGMIVPVALAVGLGVAAASLFLHPLEPPSLGRLRAYIAQASSARRGQLLIGFPLAALAVVVFLVWSARLGLVVLASEASAKASGATLGLVSALIALGLGISVVGVARAFGPRFGAAAPGPLVTLGAGLVGALVLIGILVATGTTSGSGGSLAMFGVLKRPELDLRAPALLAVIALGAYLVPALLIRLPLLLISALALLPLALSFQASRSGLNERRIALSMERGAPLSKLMLGALRKLSDRDRDGFSARFGGGDCDDSRADVNPGADDLPGNGLDEDCSGRDAERIALSAAAPASGAAAAKAALAAIPKPLNLVLITIDTLRHDLGFTGYARPISPNIDRLAKQSVVFENAYALASYTSKSLAPMLIGKYGSETHRGWSHFNRFEKEDLFLQERLQKAGLRTLSVQGYWYFFHAGYGFERGFDVVDSSAAPKAIQMEGDRTVTADKVSDAAIAQLSKPENVGRQFFLWVHYVDPHSEYVRHEGFDFGSTSRDSYDSEVAFVDHQVGRLLDFLTKSAFAKQTAIVLTSDHGEAFGEHGMIRHGFELWEELVRVPLMVQIPGVAAHRISARRSQIDLVPTLLELLGQPAPSGQGTDFVSGQSLLAEIAAPDKAPQPKIVFVDMAAGPNNAERQAFIDNDLKLVSSGGRALSLFELSKDPAEKHDLLDDAAIADPVLSRFKAFRRELRTVNVRPVPK